MPDGKDKDENLALPHASLTTMATNKRKKRPKPDNDERTKRVPFDSLLTPSATTASPSDWCWKCKGKGLKFQKSTQSYDGPTCKVCNGEGIRKRSKRSNVLASAPGKILNLRGYPEDHSLRKIFPDGFAGPRAVWGNAASSHHLRHRHLNNGRDGHDEGDHGYNDSCAYDDLPNNLRPREGEIIGSLGCGDWRIYQIADGNKLTVDDFVCAWVAAQEMRKRGYGAQLHRENAVIKCCDGDGDVRSNNEKMFGGKTDNEKHPKLGQSVGINKHNLDMENNYGFNHADIGTGCGSVLMMIAWAFLGEIRSVGVEAQSISFECLRRGLGWNLGRDGTSTKDTVQIIQNDLRTWDGCGVNDDEFHKTGARTTKLNVSGRNDQSSCIRAPYRLITGTPPYFPLDSFVASQNHEQKVRCRVPTRGGAMDYIEVASRFLMEEKLENSIEYPDGNVREGVFCMVEAAFDKAEAAVLDAVKKFNMRVRRRVDVVTRSGLPPRFSCWVMTKKNSSKIDKEDSTTASCQADNEETKSKKESNTDGCDPFPIEIFTLRNADLSRTIEYTHAMEVMGWVDFEKSKSKRNKTMKEMIDRRLSTKNENTGARMVQ